MARQSKKRRTPQKAQRLDLPPNFRGRVLTGAGSFSIRAYSDIELLNTTAAIVGSVKDFNRAAGLTGRTSRRWRNEGPPRKLTAKERQRFGRIVRKNLNVDPRLVPLANVEGYSPTNDRRKRQINALTQSINVNGSQRVVDRKIRNDDGFLVDVLGREFDDQGRLLQVDKAGRRQRALTNRMTIFKELVLPNPKTGRMERVTVPVEVVRVPVVTTKLTRKLPGVKEKDRPMVILSHPLTRAQETLKQWAKVAAGRGDVIGQSGFNAAASDMNQERRASADKLDWDVRSP